MNENLLNNTSDIRFYHYSIVIGILSSVSAFICGFYLSESICHIELKNNTNI